MSSASARTPMDSYKFLRDCRRSLRIEHIFAALDQSPHHGAIVGTDIRITGTLDSILEIVGRNCAGVASLVLAPAGFPPVSGSCWTQGMSVRSLKVYQAIVADLPALGCLRHKLKGLRIPVGQVHEQVLDHLPPKSHPQLVVDPASGSLYRGIDQGSPDPGTPPAMPRPPAPEMEPVSQWLKRPCIRRGHWFRSGTTTRQYHHRQQDCEAQACQLLFHHLVLHSALGAPT